MLPIFPASTGMLQHWRQGVKLHASRWLCIDGADNDPHMCVFTVSRNNSIHSYTIPMFIINIKTFSTKSGLKSELFNTIRKDSKQLITVTFSHKKHSLLYHVRNNANIILRPFDWGIKYWAILYCIWPSVYDINWNISTIIQNDHVYFKDGASVYHLSLAQVTMLHLGGREWNCALNDSCI